MNKILTIYDGPAFTFKLGLAISGKKKGWIFIQHNDCNWVPLRKAVDYENGADKPIEVKPYALSIKPFKEVMANFNDNLNSCHPANRDVTPDMQAFGELVGIGIYNRVWEDIKKQLTED